MKKIIFFIVSTSFLSAWTTSSTAYSYSIANVDYCLYDVVWNADFSSFTYYYDGTFYNGGTPTSLDAQSATDAYYYNNICNLEPQSGDYVVLNMTLEDYNLMMALTANLLGFTLVFLVGFLFLLQGRR